MKLELHPLYPKDDKANLTIEKTDDNSVKFTFTPLKKYLNRLGLILGTTVGFSGSGDFRTPFETKKHLSNVATIASENNNEIYRDGNGTLKFVRSVGSSDITISYRLSQPERLKDKYEIEINNSKINNPTIISELLEILNKENV